MIPALEFQPNLQVAVPARSAPRMAIIAVVSGCLVGSLDLAAQVHGPAATLHLFNSPAVWAAFAFAIGVWASRPSLAMPLSVVATVAAVNSYYLADVVFRGADISRLTSTANLLWSALAVGAGVLFGGAGSALHSPSPWRRTTARALLPSALAAEATHILVIASHASSRTDLRAAGIVLACSAAISAVLLSRRESKRSILAIAVIGTIGVVLNRLIFRG
jgi:hypothetical protein